MSVQIYKGMASWLTRKYRSLRTHPCLMKIAQWPVLSKGRSWWYEMRWWYRYFLHVGTQSIAAAVTAATRSYPLY